MNGDDLKMINQKNGFIIESYESNSKMNENIEKSIEAMSDNFIQISAESR